MLRAFLLIFLPLFASTICALIPRRGDRISVNCCCRSLSVIGSSVSRVSLCGNGYSLAMIGSSSLETPPWMYECSILKSYTEDCTNRFCTYLCSRVALSASVLFFGALTRR
ncbi:uncharacterized protein BJ212DRAFT_1362250 [Suillus subaureus]|uniref:Secreted protein n=1 Tax=Suillus subaureus TaxID=48587 RepID=A0A9P7E992_9AGAM|nr:uncharacterized protein BJ212DRAFT_1362250 [Suillus subaureus]KAG1814229.1 hypothetical protein BJ212DRAFT_1362250 [Suillus subaureus]